MKKQTIVITLLLLLAVFGLPAAANWAYNGFHLTTNSSGTVYGGVYAGVGDNDDQTFTSATVNHTSNYTLPTHGIDVKWARLYVDAWGGNEDKDGWINITFSGHAQSRWYGDQSDQGNHKDAGKLDTHPDNFGSGHGVIWARFNVTDNVTSGVNQVNVTSTIFNGRVFRAVLVCAYNDTDGCGCLVNYWVNDGNYNLHYDSGSGFTDNTTAWFNGTAYNATTDDLCCAKMTTVYHSSGGGSDGTDPEPDYLYFNVIPTTTDHSPYYNSDNQLDHGDYADGVGYWTMKSESVGHLLSPSDNNATFWRGYNATNGLIYHHPTYTEPAGAEGEAYLHPMLAVLTVNRGICCKKNIVGGWVDNLISLPLIDSEPVDTALESLPGDSLGGWMLYRYDPTTPVWELFGVAAGFTEIECGEGYSLQVQNDCILTWTSDQCCC